MPRRSRYSDQDIAWVYATYDIVGNERKTALLTNIPKTTVHSWLNKREIKEDVEATEEIKMTIAERIDMVLDPVTRVLAKFICVFEEVIKENKTLTVEEARELLPIYKDLARTTGILFDKRIDLEKVRETRNSIDAPPNQTANFFTAIMTQGALDEPEASKAISENGTPL